MHREYRVIDIFLLILNVFIYWTISTKESRRHVGMGTILLSLSQQLFCMFDVNDEKSINTLWSLQSDGAVRKNQTFNIAYILFAFWLFFSQHGIVRVAFEYTNP